MIGAQAEVVQTQVCRTQEEVLSTGEAWKAAMGEKGWQVRPFRLNLRARTGRLPRPFRGHRPSGLLLSMSECASQCLDAIRVRAVRSAAKRQATRGALGFWVGITTPAATHLTTALVASVVLRPLRQSTPSDSTSAMRVPISCRRTR